jgi:hypothetical protein
VSLVVSGAAVVAVVAVAVATDAVVAVAVVAGGAAVGAASFANVQVVRRSGPPHNCLLSPEQVIEQSPSEDLAEPPMKELPQ